MADEKLYEVETILGKKVLPSRRVLYLVRWRGFSSDHDSWEPFQNLDACKPLIHIYNKHLEEKEKASPASPKQSPQKKVDGGGDGPINKDSPKRKSAGKNLASILSKAKGSISKTREERKSLPHKQNERKSKSSADLAIKLNKTKSSSSKEKSKNNVEATKTRSDKDDVALPGGVANKSSPPKGQKRKLDKKDEEVSPKSSGPSKAKKMKKDEKTDDQEVKESDDYVEVISSDTGSEDADDDDDDVLYSLNPDCDMPDTVSDDKQPTENEEKVNKKSAKSKKSAGGTKSVISQQDTSKSVDSDKVSKKSGEKKKKSKRMSLMDSKKQPKDWLTRSGLLRSVSPPPIFTSSASSVKHLVGSPDTQDPSKPSGNSLPDPVSPEASETYLADVPSSYPVSAEEPLTNEEPLSPGSLSYKSILDSLPDQLRPPHKGGKKSKGDNSSVSSTGSISFKGTSLLGREPVERRTSVRSTECAFRYKQIVVKKCFRYTQIWLNSQTVMKNALNPQVIQEVVSALNSAKYDDSHLVLFSSLGNVFCSGTDLHFLVSGDRKVSARQMADAIRDLTKTFITFPKPIIAAVSGAAVGLGVSLLALCDVVYASDKASFYLPYSQLSQTPEGCSSFTLPLTLGLPSANELLFGGRKITAMEAYQLGLVSQVFWPTLMMQEVIPRAQNMASCSAKALEATKLLIRSHHRTKMELTNETECNLLLERWLSVDCQRAIEAYLSNEKNLTF